MLEIQADEINVPDLAPPYGLEKSWNTSDNREYPVQA